MQQALYRWLQDAWYGHGRGAWLLLPLSGLYWLAVSLRRSLYAAGILRREHVPVPVIVVGNLTAGGTGKTPVCIWLAQALQARGFAPGIVSRGYGGSKSASPMRVDARSDPAVVGDEPVLLARRTGLPVCVDRNRVRAARMLVEDGVDVIIADDGLQHLKLVRDYEICVLDGRRGLGNRYLLPAGPLRDSIAGAGQRPGATSRGIGGGTERDRIRTRVPRGASPERLAVAPVVRFRRNDRARGRGHRQPVPVLWPA
jgi:tetraacyldisaccharide 4'-kinase